ncbi:MAG: hypothetical protein GX164_03990 [Clostridiales bacterium]|nr:hypothetical protein [Clostridiales bacterium]
MKVLILSENTGEGHNSTAVAIKEALAEVGTDCDIQNALSLQSVRLSKFISNSHSFCYKYIPRLYGIGYMYEEKKHNKLSSIKTKAARRLYETVVAGGYEAVICVHVFGAIIYTEAKKNFGLSVPGYFVATDYTCSPGVNLTDMNAYFIPHRHCAHDFIRKGVPEEKLVVSGIPVRRTFLYKTDKAVARAELGLPVEGIIVLLAFGSIGCGPILEIYKLLISRLPKDVTIVVITGRNKRIYNKLTEGNINTPKNVHIVGYTDKMMLYMDAADFFMTKSGGLSTTEAIAKGIPLFCIDAVPGCETRNYEFFTKHNYVLYGKTNDELVNLVVRCVKDPALTKPYLERWKIDFPSGAADMIVRYIMSGKSDGHDNVTPQIDKNND